MISDAEILQAYDAFGGSKRAAAKHLGIPRSTFRFRHGKINNTTTELTIPEAPSGDETTAELLERKRTVFERRKENHDFYKLVNVAVNHSKPIAVTMIGDPHLDDDGCDISALDSDLSCISRTQGMYAGHLGDLTNNWIGRLARLYANQSTTAAQAIKLMEWMLEKAPNLFVVGGNHDCWGQGMDLISFVLRQQRAVVNPHGMRIALNFHNGRQVRIHARHDFAGNSQYNSTHGHRKQQLWGGNKDHIYVSGHRHHDAASVTPQSDGTCSWAFMVSGYKELDEYHDSHGFVDSYMGHSVTCIINPNAKVEAELVKPYWDIEAAADYLTFLRR